MFGGKLFYSDLEHSNDGEQVIPEVKIIYPSRNAHGVVRKFTSNITSISNGNRLVLGGEIKKNPTRRIRFLEKNITVSNLENLTGVILESG